MNLVGALAKAGVLGINRRNSEITLRENPRRLYPRVDDKLLTKELLAREGIASPALLAVARQHSEVRGLLEALRPHRSFVLKPAHGAMGNGILVIRDRDDHRYLRAGGRWTSESDVFYHAASIISGLYSLSGQRDAAFAEERLEIHPDFARIAIEGVPDVRLVVYRGVPVMSMTRLPTRAARGRANLHQGAVGAGIDLESGRTTHAVLHSTPVSVHPDTGESVLGVAIPEFARALDTAVRAADATELGYVGADIVVDVAHGPVVLELNARPGLAIQLANRAGLLPRLRDVEELWRAGMPLADRLELGREITRRNRPLRAL